MAVGARGRRNHFAPWFLAYAFPVLIISSAVTSKLPESFGMIVTLLIHKDANLHRHLLEHYNSDRRFGTEIPDKITVYTDASDVVKIYTVKSSDLSASWIWINSSNGNQIQPEGREDGENSSQEIVDLENSNPPPTDARQQTIPIDPKKIRRQKSRENRKERRTAELFWLSKDTDTEQYLENEAINNSKNLNTSIREQYSIWRREYPSLDYTLEIMKNQIIMAKVYGSIARSSKTYDLNEYLQKCIRDSIRSIGEANSDAELHEGVLEQVKEMGHALFLASEQIYDCPVVVRKLQAMVLYRDESLDDLKKENKFLLHLATQMTIPKSLHCLSLQLATDYFLRDPTGTELLDKSKLEDHSLYHYAIFSDNVLATSVVVNSTVTHAKEPEKHVFHIVTDRLNFAAMRMWFIVHPPLHATVHVESIDEFKWLNSSYCPVLRQLESKSMKEYYFKENHTASLSEWDEHLKFKNPKYLSMLNHIRFYIPEVYPKLDKILFLDDDVVVQKDLTPLWSIDMEGKVNGAVETCKGDFHRLDGYVNFSNPIISENFDPKYCAWAFGMNIFNLNEWRKQNVTSIYHYWQNLNDDRMLWKLGSLPPGLISFYGQTHVIDPSWHALKLGYELSINSSEIQDAGVIHYNGNNKPWLDVAITKYKSYWSKFVDFDNPYLRSCDFSG